MTDIVTVIVDNQPIEAMFYDENTLEAQNMALLADQARAEAAASAALAMSAFDNLYDDFATGAAATANGDYFAVLDTTTDRALVYLKGTSVDGDHPVLSLLGVGRLNSNAGAGELGTADGKKAQDKFNGLQRNLREISGSTANGVSSNQTAMTSMIALGQAIIPAQGNRYVMTAPINVPGGTKIYFQGGPRILYTGDELGNTTARDGAFRFEGDDIEFVSQDGTKLEFEFQNPGRSQYMFVNRGHSRCTVRGVSVKNGNVAYLWSADEGDGLDLDYADVDTDEATGNCGFDNTVEDWECRFDDQADAQYRGAVAVGFQFRFNVHRGKCFNVDHGVFMWGDNASHLASGAITNERKCGLGKVSFIEVYFAKGCSVWGSMFRDTVIFNCYGEDAGDVAFDGEGVLNVTFKKCVQRRAENGCFSGFFYNRNLRFEECEGYQDDPTKPIFRINNQSQSFDNRDIVVSGGHFECTGGIGVFGAQGGPVRHLKIEGANFVNVRILALDNNSNTIAIKNNTMLFTVAASAPFDAILAGGCNKFEDLRGNVTITGNTIRSQVAQPAGTAAIATSQFDFNASAHDKVSGNDIFGFDIPVRPGFSGENAGFVSSTVVTGNTADVALIQRPSGTFTVDVATDVLTSTMKGTKQGQLVRVSNSGGALPGGLSAGTNYYWIYLTPTTGKLATSRELANAGTNVGISDAGTGTHSIFEGVAQASVTVPAGSNLTTAGGAIS